MNMKKEPHQNPDSGLKPIEASPRRKSTYLHIKHLLSTADKESSNLSKKKMLTCGGMVVAWTFCSMFMRTMKTLEPFGRILGRLKCFMRGYALPSQEKGRIL